MDEPEVVGVAEKVIFTGKTVLIPFDNLPDYVLSLPELMAKYSSDISGILKIVLISPARKL
jgi:hypothetical protein